MASRSDSGCIEMDQKKTERIRHEFRFGKPHGVEFSLSINVRLEEMRDWKPELVQAFMGGIARVIVVENQTRRSE
jgi:hypothetical protein